MNQNRDEEQVKADLDMQEAGKLSKHGAGSAKNCIVGYYSTDSQHQEQGLLKAETETDTAHGIAGCRTDAIQRKNGKHNPPGFRHQQNPGAAVIKPLNFLTAQGINDSRNSPRK
jgi:hypothetical protein